MPKFEANDVSCYVYDFVFHNNEYVNVGDTVLSIQSAKSVTQIKSEYSGYIQYLFEQNDEVNVGSTIFVLYDNIDDIATTADNKESSVTFNATKKAIALAQQHNIDLSDIKKIDIIKQSDVKHYLEQKGMI